MHESINTDFLDALDRKIIQSLQVWPRAPWSVLGGVLEVDPITISRRWDRMQQHGVAWISAYPVSQGIAWDDVGALVELRVQPSEILNIVEALRNIPAVGTIRSMVSDWNISLDTRARSMAGLEKFLIEELGAIPGVLSFRSSLTAEVAIEGSSWRLNELSAAAEKQLAELADRSLGSEEAESGFHEVDLDIIRVMFQDGRATVNHIASEIGASINTVKKHLHHLLKGKNLILRCDMARAVSGWPVTVRFLGVIPLQKQAHIVERLKKIAEIRSCLILVGPNNVMLNVWLKSYSDISKFEAYLTKTLPELEIRDRSVITSFSKLMWKNVAPDGTLLQDVPTTALT